MKSRPFQSIESGKSRDRKSSIANAANEIIKRESVVFGSGRFSVKVKVSCYSINEIDGNHNNRKPSQ